MCNALVIMKYEEQLFKTTLATADNHDNCSRGCVGVLQPATAQSALGALKATALSIWAVVTLGLITSMLFWILPSERDRDTLRILVTTLYNRLQQQAY
jgi:hypothetical protein